MRLKQHLLLRLRPVSRSHRAARTWTCAPPLAPPGGAPPSMRSGRAPSPAQAVLLEGVQDRLDLLVGGLVVRCPGDHAGGVPVLEVERVGHRGHLISGVTAQHLDALARLPGRVPLPDEVAGRVARRAGSAGARNLMMHRRSLALEARASATERPLDGDQVGDHLDGLDGRLVGVRPPSDLVEVVPDARRLPWCARARPRPPGRSMSACGPWPRGSAPTAGRLRLRPWPASRRVRPPTRGR